MKTNTKSVMPAGKQKKMLGMSPTQYAGSGGSLTKGQVQSYHNTKGNSLGVTKGKKVKANPTFGLKKVGVASTSKTQFKK